MSIQQHDKQRVRERFGLSRLARGRAGDDAGL